MERYHYCELPDCNRPHAARGLCKLHYDRWRRDGDGFDKGPAEKPTRLCELPDCEQKHFCKGLCSSHFNRRRHAERAGRPDDWSRAPAYSVPPGRPRGRDVKSWRDGD